MGERVLSQLSKDQGCWSPDRVQYQRSTSLTLSMLVFVIDDDLHDGSRRLLRIHECSPVTSGPGKAGQTSSLSAWWGIIVWAVVRMSLWNDKGQIQSPESTNETTEMDLAALEAVWSFLVMSSDLKCMSTETNREIGMWRKNSAGSMLRFPSLLAGDWPRFTDKLLREKNSPKGWSTFPAPKNLTFRFKNLHSHLQGKAECDRGHRRRIKCCAN